MEINIHEWHNTKLFHLKGDIGNGENGRRAKERMKEIRVGVREGE